MNGRLARTSGGICLAGVLTSLAVSAHAQSGPSRSLEVTVSTELRHDSNVSRIGGGRANVLGLDRSDQSVRPAIDVTLVRPLGAQLLTLDASAGYDFYRRNTELNRERLSLNSDLAVNFGRCSGNLDAGISRRQSDLGEVFFIDTPGVGSFKNAETVQRYGANATCGGPIGFTPGAGIDYERGDNSNDFRRFSDFHSISYNASLGYSQPSLGMLSLVGRIVDVDYPNRPAAARAGDGYMSRSLSGRFERRIGSRLMGVVEVGLSDVDTGSMRDGFTGVTWSADLSGNFADRVQFDLGISRSVQPSFQNEATFQIQQAYRLNGTYFINDSFSLNAGASFTRRRFEGVDDTLGLLLTGDRRSVYSASLNYDRSDRLRVSLSTSYDQRNANGTIYDYDSFGAALRIALTI